MKQSARKLLSLLMAFVMVLSLAPAALATSGGGDGGGSDGDGDGDGTPATVTAAIDGTTTVEVGSTITLTAKITSDNQEVTDVTGYTIKWSVTGDVEIDGSDNAKTVKIKGKSFSGDSGSGTVKLSVTPSGGSEAKAEQNITVNAKKTASVEIATPSSTNLTVGDTTGISLSAEIKDGTGTITWSAKPENIVTISPATGTSVKVTSTATSVTQNTEVTITAAIQGQTDVKDTVKITVKPATPSVASVTFSPSSVTLTAGETANITATVASTIQYKTVDWSITSATESARVVGLGGDNINKATIYGDKAGSAVVKAVFKDSAGKAVAEGTANVKVNAAAALTFVSTTTSPINITNSNKTGKFEVKLSGLPTGTSATKYTVKWEVTSGTGNVFLSRNSATLNTNGTAYTTISGLKNGKATVTATLYEGSNTRVEGVAPVSCTVDVDRTGLFLVGTPTQDESYKLTSGGKTFSVDVYDASNGTKITGDRDVRYTWEIDGYDLDDYYNYNSSYTLYASDYYLSTKSSTLRCTVTYGNFKDSIAWTVSSDIDADISVSATVSSTYYLGDRDDKSSYSIWEKIENQLPSTYTLDYIEFSQVSSTYGDLDANTRDKYEETDLDAVRFDPEKKGDAVFKFDAYAYRKSSSKDERFSGVLTITVTDTVDGGDITYTADLGKDVALDADDFENFWTDIYKNGDLDYVTFSSVSGGSLTDSSNKSAGSRKFYYNPGRSQDDLDDLTFSPNNTTSKKATTVRIKFTAYGTTSRTSTRNESRDGTVVINYLNQAASTIKYSTKNNTVALNPADFIAAYKEVTGSKSNPNNLTIVFQGVPTYGSLTYNDSSKSSSKDVSLRSNNIKSYKFNTKTTKTSNKLEDVTYTGSNGRTDTISYIAYVGNNASFTGEVTFNSTTINTSVRVPMTCTSASGVALLPGNFTGADTSMLNASYVIFNTSPLMGTLTYYGATAVGNRVLVSALSGVMYVPSASAKGTDTFNFTAYDSSNNIVANGSVVMTVSLPTTTTPGAITSVDQFTDVPAAGGMADWYRPQLSYLINKGVIKGTGGNTFEPGAELSYGEAVKFILNAAGYVEVELSGANWALNYMNRAIQNGWLPSGTNQNNKITRDAMAELAAKALGFKPVSVTAQTSPFSDSTNSYAVALFNNKIVTGNDNSAKPAFNGGSYLMRCEMVCLVQRMYQYTGK